MAVLRPTATVTLNGVPVIPIEGNLTLSEIDTYATAEYTIPYTGRAQLAAIDVIGGVRTVVGVSSWNTYKMWVRSYSVDHAAHTVRIVAASDETLLDDYAPLTDDPTPQTKEHLWDVLNYVLAVVSEYNYFQMPSLDGEEALLWKPSEDSLLWSAGTSAWNFLATLVSGAGLVLYSTAPTLPVTPWWIRTTSDAPEGSLVIPYGTVSQLEEESSRDSGKWVTGVVVRYRWTNSAGVVLEHVDTAGTPGRVETLTFDRPYPGQGFAGYRLRLLQAQASMRTFTFDHDPAVRFLPGMTAYYYPGDDVVARGTGRVQSATWDLYSGKVTVTLRDVSEFSPMSWESLEAGEQWIDSPVGESWIEEGA